MRNPLQHVPRLGILALPLHCKRGSGRTTARAPIWPGGLSLCSARETVFSASSFAPDFKLRHHPRPNPLDTACIIKEEPNSASVVSRLTGTGPGICRPIWPQGGETNRCIYTKSARTPSGLIRHAIVQTAPILYEVQI